MTSKARGPLYGVGVFALIVGMIVLAAGALSIIFRGQSAYPVRVFGSAEQWTPAAGEMALRPERPPALRRGGVSNLLRLRPTTAPPEPPRAEAVARLHDQAKEWVSREEWSRALSAYDRLLRTRPDDHRLAVERSRVLAWSGHPLQAARALLLVAGARPDDAALRVEAARYFWWAGHAQEADSLLSEVRALGAADADLLALQEEIRGTMRPTVPVAQRWLRERAGAWEHLQLARAYVDESHFAEAVPHYRAALGQGVGSDSVYLELASAATAADSGEVAVSALRRYLRLHPGDREVRVTLARSYGWAQDYESAIAEFRGLLDERDDPKLRFELGQLYAWTGREEEAARELRRVAQADPLDAPTFRLLGDLASWRGEWELALANYHHAMALDPELEGIDTVIAETREQYRLERLAAAPMPIDQCAVGVEWFADSEGFRWLSTEGARVWEPGWGTVSLAVRQDVSAGAAPNAAAGEQTGYGVLAEVRAPVASGVTLSALLGASSYSRAGTFSTWGGGVEHDDLAGARVSLRYVHRPGVRSAATVAALEAGVTSDAVQLTASRRLAGLDVHAEAEMERLGSELGQTDRYRATVTATRALSERLSVSAGVTTLTTTGDMPLLPGWGSLYWTPELYVAPSVSLNYRASLGSHWSLGGTVTPGYAVVRERAGAQRRFQADQTPTLGLGVDALYRSGRWELGARVDWSGAVGTQGYRATTLRMLGSYRLGER